MSYKNLRSPAANAGVTSPEKVAPIPHIDEARINGDPVNTTADGEAPLTWGPPDTLPESPRLPMKLNK